MAVRVLIVDDHKLFRDGLKSLLAKQPDMEVVGESSDGITALALVREQRPDVVLMDVTMTRMNGIEAARQILSEMPEIKVIFLSMHSDRRFIDEALRIGASGYILKDSEFGELIRGVRTVMKGGLCLSKSIGDVIVRDYVKIVKGTGQSVYSLLSSREREVLQMLAEGRSTKEIAKSLCLSVKTIESHRKQLMDKLDLHSIAELTKYAIREGLTELE